MPTSCPSCGQAIIRFEEEAMSYCANAACPAQLARLLEHFVSKNAMDIEGMGTKIGVTLIEQGLVNDVSDLYSMEKTDLLEVDRMAEKSVSNLIKAINLSKDRPLAQVLVALGISHVGSEVAKLLADHFRSIYALMEASKPQLTAIPNIGPKITASVVAYFDNKTNRGVIEALCEAGVRLADDPQSKVVNQMLSGLRFVLTGRLENFSRSQIRDKIKELGGEVSAGVSRRTDYLVAGEDPGNKLADALNLKVQVVGEDEFLTMIGE